MEPLLIPFVNADGGKAAAECKENNTCVIIAICNVLGLEYAEVKERCRFNGRRKNKGTNNEVWLPIVEQYGYKAENKRIKLCDAIAAYPNEAFFFHVPGHLSSVVDGAIHDTYFNGWWWDYPVTIYRKEEKKSKVRLRFEL